MALPITPDEAQRLYDNGSISEDTFKLYQEVQPTPEETADTHGLPPPAGEPVPVSGVPMTVSAPEAPQEGLPPAKEDNPYERLTAQPDALEDYVQGVEPPAPPAPPTPPPVTSGFGTPPELLDAVEHVESRGNPNAQSPVGAKGAYQFMDATAKEIAAKVGIKDYDPTNRDQQRTMADKYLSMLKERFGSDDLALAAYNAGPGRVAQAISKAGTSDPAAVLRFLPKETQDYVPKVMGRLGAGSGDVKKKVETDPIDEYVQAGQLAATSRAKAETDLIHATGERDRAILEEQQKIAGQQLEEKNRLDVALSNADAERKKALEEFKSHTIDYDRWWSNKSTGGKIMTAIGAALLGTLISPGAAMALIGNQIDTDLADQKAQQDKLGELYKAKDNLYGEMLRRYGESQRAYYEARGAALTMAANAVTEQMATAKSDQAMAGARQLNADLLKSAEEMRQKANEQIAAQLAKDPLQAMRRRQTALQMGNQGLPLLDEKDQARAILGPDGMFIGLGRSEQDAQKMTEAIKTKGDFDTVLGRLIAIRSRAPVTYDPGTFKEGVSLAAEARAKLKQMYELGALSATDYDLMNAVIPDNPFGVGNWGLADRLTRMKTDANSSFTRELNSRLVQRSPQSMAQRGFSTRAPGQGSGR